MLWAKLHPPKFIYWRPEPQYLRRWLLFGQRTYKEVIIEVKWGHVGGFYFDSYPYKKRHTGKIIWRQREKMTIYKSRRKASEWNQSPWEHDLRLVASRNVRKFLLFKPLVSGTCIAALANTQSDELPCIHHLASSTVKPSANLVSLSLLTFFYVIIPTTVSKYISDGNLKKHNHHALLFLTKSIIS